MRILAIAFILALTTVGILEGNCPKVCHLIFQPVCGIDYKCNFVGANSCVLNIEQCWRRKRNILPFRYIHYGSCPNDKPICPGSEIRSDY